MQIYLDILHDIHLTRKSGEWLTLYHMERVAGLTHARLKKFLGELEDAGLIDADWAITERGYTFLNEIPAKVIPVLTAYGLWQHR